MSSVITGETSASHTPAVTWAAVAFIVQALTIGAPLFLQAGKLEARVAQVEANVGENRARLTADQERYTAIIDRLARIETTQRQILDAVEPHGRR